MKSEPKKINCPGCKAEYLPLSSMHPFLGCKHCGQYYQWRNGVPEKIYQFPNHNLQKPLSFIELGMQTTLFKKKYTVISRFLYKSQYREFDTDDNAYSPGNSLIEEWYLLSDAGEIICIADDEESFYLSEPYFPRAPVLPNPKVPFISFDKKLAPQRIMERGKNHLLLFEGESPTPCYPQEEIQFVSYHSNRSDFIAEWIGNSNSGYKEISFYKEKTISTSTIVDSFQGNNKLKYKYKKQELVKFAFKTFLTASITCLLLLLMTLLSENQIFKFSNPFNIDENSNSQTINSAEWSLNGDDAIYKLYFKSSYAPDNSNLSVDIDILDAKSHEIVNAFEADFWQESGYDEGNWSEQEVDAYFLFKNKDAGKYYARLTIIKDALHSNQNGVISVTVFEESISRYYFFGFLGFAILTLIFFLISKAISSANRMSISSYIFNSNVFWTVVVVFFFILLLIYGD